MGKKLPAFQFYPGDWMKDPELRSVSSGARGLWIDMLSLMFESARRGYLQFNNGKSVTAESLARMTGNSTDDASRWLQELEYSGVLSRTDDGTVFSRRQVRDEAVRCDTKERVRAHREKQRCNTDVTHPVTHLYEDEDEKEKAVAIEGELPKPKAFVEFNGEMWVKAILNSHPLPNWGQHTTTFLLEAIEIEAREHGWSLVTAAEYLHERTKLYSLVVKTVGTSAYRATCGATKFFQDKIYRQDEAMWRKPADGKEARPIEPGIRVHRPDKVDPEEFEKIKREGDAVIARLKAKRVGA